MFHLIQQKKKKVGLGSSTHTTCLVFFTKNVIENITLDIILQNKNIDATDSN